MRDDRIYLPDGEHFLCLHSTSSTHQFWSCLNVCLPSQTQIMQISDAINQARDVDAAGPTQRRQRQRQRDADRSNRIDQAAGA
jgi:hypothetical protein